MSKKAKKVESVEPIKLRELGANIEAGKYSPQQLESLIMTLCFSICNDTRGWASFQLAYHEAYRRYIEEPHGINSNVFEYVIEGMPLLEELRNKE